MKNGDSVIRGQRLVEWDQYTRSVVSEISGVVSFQDLIEGVSVSETVDENTGITKRIVKDWRLNSKSLDIRPAIVVASANFSQSSKDSIKYYLSPGAIISVDSSVFVKAGDTLVKVSMDSAKTRDITGGLPRVAELFEARRPKDYAIISDVKGIVRFDRDYKNKRKITIVPEDQEVSEVEYFVPKGRYVYLQEGDYVDKGDLIVDGNPVPHDILAVKGVEALAAYMVSEVQEVYRLQGVTINDKHIEVIVRQMLQKVEVCNVGDSNFLKGELVDKVDIDEENVRLISLSLSPILTRPVLLGITKASLQTKSFFSSASFQETTRVLTDAAVAGKIDYLEGLKENIIVGRLIPAGTGRLFSSLKLTAKMRDSLILEQNSKDDFKSSKKVKDISKINFLEHGGF